MNRSTNQTADNRNLCIAVLLTNVVAQSLACVIVVRAEECIVCVLIRQRGVDFYQRHAVRMNVSCSGNDGVRVVCGKNDCVSSCGYSVQNLVALLLCVGLVVRAENLYIISEVLACQNTACLYSMPVVGVQRHGDNRDGSLAAGICCRSGACCRACRSCCAAVTARAAASCEASYGHSTCECHR